MLSLRIKRVNELLKKEFGRIIFEEVDNRKGGLITVTRVETSSDLQHAKIYISIFPEREKERINKLLDKQIYKLQKILDKRLYMRPVPKIRLLNDLSGEKFTKINKLLNGP